MFEHLLLEQPLPVIGLFAVVGLILLFQNRRRTDQKLLVMAGGLLVATSAVYGLAATVKTQRESLADQTDYLGKWATPKTMEQFRELFLPHAILVGPDGVTWMQLKEMFTTLETTSKKYRVRKQSVRQIHPEVNQRGIGRSFLAVHTTLQMSGQAVNTEWMITWKLAADGAWKVQKLQWLEFQNRKPAFGIWQ